MAAIQAVPREVPPTARMAPDTLDRARREAKPRPPKRQPKPKMPAENQQIEQQYCQMESGAMW